MLTNFNMPSNKATPESKQDLIAISVNDYDATPVLEDNNYDTISVVENNDYSTTPIVEITDLPVLVEDDAKNIRQSVRHIAPVRGHEYKRLFAKLLQGTCP